MNLMAVSVCPALLLCASDYRVVSLEMSIDSTEPCSDGFEEVLSVDSPINFIRCSICCGESLLLVAEDNNVVHVKNLSHLDKPVILLSTAVSGIADCSPYSGAFFHSTQHVVASANTHRLSLFDFSNPDTANQSRKGFLGHEHNVPCVAVSDDDRLIASASVDCTVKVWDIQSKEIRFSRLLTPSFGWAVRWFEAYYVKRYESTVVPLKPYSEQRRYAYRHRGILRGDENDLDARDYGLQYRLMRLLDRTEEDSTEDSDASLDEYSLIVPRNEPLIASVESQLVEYGESQDDEEEEEEGRSADIDGDGSDNDYSGDSDGDDPDETTGSSRSIFQELDDGQRSDENAITLVPAQQNDALENRGIDTAAEDVGERREDDDSAVPDDGLGDEAVAVSEDNDMNSDSRRDGEDQMEISASETESVVPSKANHHEREYPEDKDLSKPLLIFCSQRDVFLLDAHLVLLDSQKDVLTPHLPSLFSRHRLLFIETISELALVIVGSSACPQVALLEVSFIDNSVYQLNHRGEVPSYENLPARLQSSCIIGVSVFPRLDPVNGDSLGQWDLLLLYENGCILCNRLYRRPGSRKLDITQMLL